MCLRFFLVLQVFLFTVRGFFRWVARLGRLLVRCIQAIVSFIVFTYSTQRCFHLYSKWFTGQAGSEGFCGRDADGL